jgi:hypothetical protein
VPPAEAGFHSDALREALVAALRGKPAELERLFCRSGAVVTARANLKLAAAFGAEMAAVPGPASALLSRLAAEDAAPDTDRAFLPLAAAYGWAGRIRAGREVEEAWTALAELAADERAPVRVGAIGALTGLAARPGGGDELVERAAGWLDEPDRERRFGTAGVVLEVLAQRQPLATVDDQAALRDYLSRAIAEIADAPRSAERSDARRRLLAALPAALAAVVVAGGDRAQAWFAEESARAIHHGVRSALSDTVVALRSPAHGLGETVVEALRGSLQASAKPLRDPSRLRPGTGRGKASRRTR